MKPHKLGNLFAMLTLAVLFLAACQSAAFDNPNPQAKPAGTAIQPLETGVEDPVSIPTETARAKETSAPIEPAETVTEATLAAEDSKLPTKGMQVREGWQVINDATHGYSLSYPAEWRYNEETQYSRVFSEIQKEPAGMGPPLRLYVSAFPKEYTNPDWQVYNFIPIETIQEFMTIPVGESKMKEPRSPAPDYFTYTRLPDRMVAGQAGLVIENPKAWEAPSGTKDRVVLIVTEDATYILGMYYETPEQLAMFEQVLDSFQLIP